MARAAIAVLLLLAVAGAVLACPAAAAGSNKRESFKDDPRSSILIDRFSFSSHGVASVSVAGAKATSTTIAEPDPSLLGFFLLSDEALFEAITHPEKLPDMGPSPYPESPNCALTSRYIVPFFTFADLDDKGRYNKTFPVLHAGEYSLFFVRCPPETTVTMELHTHMYNVVNPA